MRVAFFQLDADSDGKLLRGSKRRAHVPGAPPPLPKPRPAQPCYPDAHDSLSTARTALDEFPILQTPQDTPPPLL